MVFGLLTGCAKGNHQKVPLISDPDGLFRMPSEDDRDEGTRLQWPHDYVENRFRNLVQRYEESWIQMTLALHTGERVHVIV
jgi:agmatine/peptidylarginine deiminase